MTLAHSRFTALPLAWQKSIDFQEYWNHSTTHDLKAAIAWQLVFIVKIIAALCFIPLCNTMFIFVTKANTVFVRL